MAWEDLQLGVLEEFASVSLSGAKTLEPGAVHRDMCIIRSRATPLSVKPCSRPNRYPPAALTKYQLSYIMRKQQLRRSGMREKLLDERKGVNRKFTIYTMTDRGVREVDAYLRTGEYPDGRIGEAFLTIGKQGDENAIYDCCFIELSIALQHGATLRDTFGKLVGQNFPPHGKTNDPEIPFCTSVIDYVARYCIAKYSGAEERYRAKKKAEQGGFDDEVEWLRSEVARLSAEAAKVGHGG